MWPEPDLRSHPSMQSFTSVYHNTDSWMPLVRWTPSHSYVDTEQSSGQAHLHLFNIWTKGAIVRTSVQPRFKPSLLLRNSYKKFQPQCCGPQTTSGVDPDPHWCWSAESGSALGVRIRIQERKNGPQKKKEKKFQVFTCSMFSLDSMAECMNQTTIKTPNPKCRLFLKI